MMDEQRENPDTDNTPTESVSPDWHDAKDIGDSMVGKEVGRYTIRRVIGSGGMGTVYEAIQQSPRRTVALKMMKQGLLSRSARRRFEYEAQTLGRLRHPNIAQIFEAGTLESDQGSRPWFAMEYLTAAKSITDYAHEKHMGTRDRLEIMRKVLDAVQHGHQRGIIHRDLKPGNIMVTSDGIPKIIDFGVARSTDSDLAVTTLQTDVGQLIGTVQYMSPEQITADPNDIDIRSDIYAVGVILYELLCEQLPYDVTKVALHEAARVVLEEAPTRPSSLDRRLRGDIETITLKALQKDRAHRYQTAVELEQDIARYLAGDPIAASRPSLWDTMQRFAKRHRAAAVSIATVVVVLVAAIIFISIFAVEAAHQRDAAEQQTDIAQQEKQRAIDALKQAETANKQATEQTRLATQARDEARQHAYVGNIHAAAAALDRHDTPDIVRRLQSARTFLDMDTEPFEWAWLYGQSDDAAIKLGEHARWISDVQWTHENTLLSIDRRQMVYRWDLESEQTTSPPLRLESGSGAVLSPTGQSVAMRAKRNVIRLQHLPPNEEHTRIEFEHNISDGPVYSDDGQRVAVTLYNNQAHIHDVATGTLVNALELNEYDGSTVKLNLDGSRIATGDYSGNVTLHDVDTGDVIAEMPMPLPTRENRLSYAFSRDQNHPEIPTQSQDRTDENRGAWRTGSTQAIAMDLTGIRMAIGGPGRIDLWMIEPLQHLWTLQHDREALYKLAFSPDSSFLACAGQNGEIDLWLWSVPSGMSVSHMATFRGHKDAVDAIDFSPDSAFLASGSKDKSVRIWDISSNSSPLVSESSSILDIATSPTSPLLAISDLLSGVQIWDLDRRKQIALLAFMKTNPTSIEISASGEDLVTGHRSGDTFVWDLLTGKQKTAGSQHDGEVRSVAVHPHGGLCATLDVNGVIHVWDGNSGNTVSSLSSSEPDINSAIGFHPDGNKLFVGSAHGTLSILDLETWAVTTTTSAASQGRGIDTIAFSPDGTTVATGGSAGLIQLWGADTSLLRTALHAHEDPITSMQFTLDGQRLVSASWDGDIKIWDVHTDENLLTLDGHDKWINALAFGHDGRTLISASNDGTVRLWPVESQGISAKRMRKTQRQATGLQPLALNLVSTAGNNPVELRKQLIRAGQGLSADQMGLLRRLALELSNDLGESKKLRTQLVVDQGSIGSLVGRYAPEHDATIDPEEIKNLILNKFVRIEHPIIGDMTLASARRLCELHDQPDPDALIDLAIIHLWRKEHAEAEKVIAQARDQADEEQLKKIDLRIAVWKMSLESTMR